TSSSRALLSARRALDMGLCDAVLCGGVDGLLLDHLYIKPAV
ncbi:hypothetical protein PSYPI_47241, partial [Pseudomonas syringae pv. pisi str. 1704B]